jgi:hypothetical protein
VLTCNGETWNRNKIMKSKQRNGKLTKKWETNRKYAKQMKECNRSLKNGKRIEKKKKKTYGMNGKQ